MRTPELYALILLSLATYRITRLAILDTFPPVEWLRNKWFATFPVTGDVIQDPPKWWFRFPKWIRLAKAAYPDQVAIQKGTSLGYVLTCPWCFGFWVSLGHFAAFQVWPVGTLQWAALWSIAAIGAFIQNMEKD